jgi:hypothetical protein
MAISLSPQLYFLIFFFSIFFFPSYNYFLTLRWLMSYIYDIRSLRANDLSLILLTWRKWWANNASN